MDNKHSNPIYPPSKHNYFGDFRVAHPDVDTAWEKVKEAQTEAKIGENSTFHNHHSHNRFDNRVDIYENEFADEITFDNIRDEYDHIELNNEMNFGYDRDFYSEGILSNNPTNIRGGNEEFAEEISVNPMVANHDVEIGDETYPAFHPSAIKFKI